MDITFYNLTAETLARVQFAFTVSFHIIFPAFSIGLASYLAVLNGLWLYTKEPHYRLLFEYWKKIFAIAFGMGVVSGIVMSYQFGTNWSVFSDKTGPVLGPLMAYEVLSATLMSATWILSVNSWMQTPAGYSINDVGQFVPENWWEIVFNPSFPYRLVHMSLAAFLTVAFVVGGVAAWHMLRNHKGAATIEEKRIDYAIKIPKVSSLILKHDLHAPLDGLDTIPDDEEPPVHIVFWSFRIMVGIGFTMLAVGLWSLWARYKKRLFDSPMLHRSVLLMAPSGFIAVLAGWITTEVGRQPYTVYGVLRTADSLAPVSAPAVAASLIGFIVVYFFVFGAGIFYILRLMSKPPSQQKIRLREGPIRTAGAIPVSQIRETAGDNR